MVFQFQKTQAESFLPVVNTYEDIDVNGGDAAGKIWRFALGSGGDNNDSSTPSSAALLVLYNSWLEP